MCQPGCKLAGEWCMLMLFAWCLFAGFHLMYLSIRFCKFPARYCFFFVLFMHRMPSKMLKKHCNMKEGSRTWPKFYTCPDIDPS
jgi:hypothetical protein